MQQSNNSVTAGQFTIAKPAPPYYSRKQEEESDFDFDLYEIVIT